MDHIRRPFLKLVESWGVDNDIAIDCMPPLFTVGVVMVKYFNGVFHVRKLTDLCNMIRSDSERLKDLPHFEVLHYHALQGRRFVVSFTIALTLLLLIYLTLPTALIVHDLLTKNDSEDKYMMYQGDYYFVEVQDYYYIQTVHSYTASITMIVLICSLDSMFIIFIQHACAMFAVTGYRLKTVHILDVNTSMVKVNKTEYENYEDAQEQMYAKLILCVKEHQRAIECTRIVQAAFSVTLFLQVSMNILALSITGIQALLKMSGGNISDMLRLAIWIMGQYIHLVFIHFPGQRLSNFSEQVYYDMLECRWHKFSGKSRVIFQFLSMNTLIPCRLTALKVTTLNMETLLSFLKLVESWGVDNDIAIDCMPPLFTMGVVMVKYFNGVFHVRKLTDLCNMIRSDSERLKDLPHFEVLHYHALQGRRFVVSFTIALSLLLLIYLTLPTVLIVHDLLTKNDSEDKYMMYQGDYYFVEVQDYYYFETVHSYIASITMIVLICSLDSMFIIFIQHACAMFAVTGYRLKTVHILDVNTSMVKVNKTEYENYEDAQEQMYAKLILCVKEHQRAIECTRIVQAAFSVTLFLQVSMNILILSITGIQALLKMSDGNISDMLRLAIWMMGQYIHLVFIHFPGQRLSNFSEQVYYDMLECRWHKFSGKSRVIFQFLSMNTLIPCRLTALKVTTLNMETLLSFLKLVESWGVDNDIAIDCMPPLFTMGVVMVKYFNGVFHVRKLTDLCNMIRSDSERLKDLPHFEVLHFHALQGRRFVVSFTIALSLLLLIYLALPTVLIVHDLLTKNDSEDKYMMYQADYYFVEIQDYYYFETVHSYIASITMIVLICSLDSMFIIFIQHACAMFAVTGYRLKTVHILDVNTSMVKVNKTEYENYEDAQEQMYAKLILCVKEHQRAIECTRIVQAAFSVTLFLQVSMNILILSITGIQALLKMSDGNISDMLRLAIWMMGQYIHLVFIHFPGQRLSNFSEQVYYDMLECRWHKFSGKSRVMYQFLIMNTLIPCRLTALKVTTLNMETLLSFTQAAVSYFTVLSSSL